MSAHKCNAECWPYMLRYGPPADCDPFAAREAADSELAALGMSE